MGDEIGSSGQLGKLLAEHRQGVLLFDEIEKTHQLIWDLLSQMPDAARITLADHRPTTSLDFMHQQYRLAAAFAPDPASIRHAGTGSFGGTPSFFPPRVGWKV